MDAGRQGCWQSLICDHGLCFLFFLGMWAVHMRQRRHFFHDRAHYNKAKQRPTYIYLQPFIRQPNNIHFQRSHETMRVSNTFLTLVYPEAAFCLFFFLFFFFSVKASGGYTLELAYDGATATSPVSSLLFLSRPRCSSIRVFFFQGRPNFCSQLVSFSVRFFLSDSTLR